MNGNCFEIGIIQAFLDGELEPGLSARFTDHVADCDTCALELARAEEESSIVFPALEREFDTLVPTHRLWARINEGIIEEKKRAPFWQRFREAILAQIASPSLAAAAMVLLIFGIFAALWGFRQSNTGPAQTVASNSVKTPAAPARMGDVEVTVPSNEVDTPEVTPPRVERASYSREPVKAITADYRVKGLDTEAPRIIVPQYLPGEESYVRTIDRLTKTAKAGEDSAIRPSARIGFERDMAVVDDAITRMRKEVRNNPNNESARQVLYTSYQNKIDLLNSVAQKEELLSMR